MTEVERLDNKFKEVLKSRKLEDTIQSRGDAVVASEKVMDIFKYGFINDTKGQEIKMHNRSDMFLFSVKVPDGGFYIKHECFSAKLKKALIIAESSIDEEIKEQMLIILNGYFEISEDPSGTTIRI